MQQAIVISSHYDASSGYPNLSSWTPSAELLAARLAQHGYDIERLLPGAGLIKRLRSHLRSENPHASVIFYFAGYSLVTEKGDPALLLADETVTALRLTQLVSRTSRSFGRVLLLLDTTLGSARADVEDACRSMDVPITSSPEKSMGELALSACDAENVSVLMSVRPWGQSDKHVSPFARLLERGLKELSNAHSSTSDGDLYTWLRNAPDADQLTLRFLAARPSFVVLPRRQYPSNPEALAPSPMVRMGVVPPMPPPPPATPAQAVNAPASPPPPAPLPAPVQAADPPATPPPAPLSAPVQAANAPVTPPPPGPLPAPAPASVAPAAPEPATPEPAAPEPATSARPSPDPTTTVSSASSVTQNQHFAADVHSQEPHAPAEPVASASAPAEPLAPAEPPAPRSPEEPATTAPAATAAGSPESTSETSAASALEQMGRAVLARREEQAAVAETAANHPEPPAFPSRPPQAPAPFAGPESWRPPPGPTPHRDAEDEAGLVARARAAQEGERDDEALALARKCLSLFPQSVAALQIAATLLAKLEQWEELAGLYEQLIAGHLDAPAVSKLCIAASRLYVSKLNSPGRAANVLERACELQPKNSAAHLEAAAFYENESRLRAAEGHYVSAMAVDPLSLRCYRRASAFFSWTKQLDAAWNAAAIVAALGPSNQVEQELLDKYGVEGLPRPSRPLASGDFSAGLSASASDPALAQLFAFLGETVRSISLPKPKVQQQMLKDCTAEDPTTSTTTLARAFNWTCQLLSIGMPGLYLADSDHLPALLPVEQAAWLVGKAVGRGLSAQELVFLWARALSRLRPEARSSLYAADAGGLTTLVDACFVATGRMEAPSAEAARLAKGLKKKLEANGLAALGEKLEGISPNNAPARVGAWERQLELIANRVALLACGSPRIAANMLERFPMGQTPHREQLADLFSYTMGQSYRTLRSELGLAIH